MNDLNMLLSCFRTKTSVLSPLADPPINSRLPYFPSGDDANFPVRVNQIIPLSGRTPEMQKKERHSLRYGSNIQTTVFTCGGKASLSISGQFLPHQKCFIINCPPQNKERFFTLLSCMAFSLICYSLTTPREHP